MGRASGWICEGVDKNSHPALASGTVRSAPQAKTAQQICARLGGSASTAAPGSDWTIATLS